MRITNQACKRRDGIRHCATLPDGPLGKPSLDASLSTAARLDPGLRSGINVAGGHVTNAAVAASLAMPLTPVEEILGATAGAA